MVKNKHCCLSNHWETLPRKQIFTQSQQQNAWSKMWNLLKTNGRDCVSLLTNCNISKTFFQVFFWCTVNMSLSCSFLMSLSSILERFHVPWHTFSVIRRTKSRARRTGWSKHNNEKVFLVKSWKGAGEHLIWGTSTNCYFWKGGTDILLIRFWIFIMRYNSNFPIFFQFIFC